MKLSYVFPFFLLQTVHKCNMSITMSSNGKLLTIFRLTSKRLTIKGKHNLFKSPKSKIKATWFSGKQSLISYILLEIHIRMMQASKKYVQAFEKMSSNATKHDVSSIPRNQTRKRCTTYPTMKNVHQTFTYISQMVEKHNLTIYNVTMQL